VIESLYGAAAGGLVSAIGHLVQRAMGTTDREIAELRKENDALAKRVGELQAELREVGTAIAVQKANEHFLLATLTRLETKFDEQAKANEKFRERISIQLGRLSGERSLEESSDGR